MSPRDERSGPATQQGPPATYTNLRTRLPRRSFSASTIRSRRRVSRELDRLCGLSPRYSERGRDDFLDWWPIEDEAAA